MYSFQATPFQAPTMKPPPPLPSIQKPIQIVIPTNVELLELLHSTISLILKHGATFECLLIKKESQKESSLFSFLWSDSVEGRYYIWRLFATLQGEGRMYWRVSPVKINGIEYIPPPIRFFESSDVPDEEMDGLMDLDDDDLFYEDDQPRREQSLSTRETLAFIKLLQDAVPSRDYVAGLMAFIMTRAYAVQTILPLLVQSMTHLTSPLYAKYARLFALNDLFWNANQLADRPHVWKFRRVEPDLGAVMKHLGECIRSAELGKLRKEVLLNKVRDVLASWRRWSVFSDERISEWETMLEGRVLEKTVVGHEEVVQKEQVEHVVEGVEQHIDERKPLFKSSFNEVGDKDSQIDDKVISQVKKGRFVSSFSEAPLLGESDDAAHTSKEAKEFSKEELQGEELDHELYVTLLKARKGMEPLLFLKKQIKIMNEPDLS